MRHVQLGRQVQDRDEHEGDTLKETSFGQALSRALGNGMVKIKYYDGSDIAVGKENKQTVSTK